MEQLYKGGICFITDRQYCALTAYDAVMTVLKAGIRFVQYRDKGRSRREIYEEAKRLRELTRRFGAAFIVNDHADIALAVEADGVHLGQEDLPLREARRIMKNRIVGISTHGLEEAKEAEAGGADYIGFGPVFTTVTKDAGAPKGIDNLRMIAHNVSIPVVAIGGIGHDTLLSVLGSGAAAAAVATSICRGDIAANTERLLSILNDFRITS